MIMYTVFVHVRVRIYAHVHHAQVSVYVHVQHIRARMYKHVHEPVLAHVCGSCKGFQSL